MLLDYIENNFKGNKNTLEEKIYFKTINTWD